MRIDRKKFYKSNAWQVTRMKVLERDNYECQHCKRDGKVTIHQNSSKHKTLDIHHIKDLVDYPELAFDQENLITLCVKCHNKEENRFQKRKPKKNKWSHDEKW